MRRVITWWRLEAKDRWQFLRVWVLLAAAELSLRWSSLPSGQQRLARLARWLGARTTTSPEDLAGWVRLAARHHLVEMTCLRQAMVLEAVLKAGGLAPELCLGAQRDGERLSAHAWVELEGQPVGQPSDTRARYPRLLAAGAPELGRGARYFAESL